MILLGSQFHHRVPSGDDSVRLLCVVGFAGKEQVVLIFLGEIGEFDCWFTGRMNKRFSLMLCTEPSVDEPEMESSTGDLPDEIVLVDDIEGYQKFCAEH